MIPFPRSESVPDSRDVKCSPDEFFGLSDAMLANMDDLQALDAVVSARRFICRAQAIQVKAIARLNRLRDNAWSLAEELAPEMRVSNKTAELRVALADALLSRMPKLLAAMDSGELDIEKARQAFEVMAPLSDDQARVADEILVTRIGTKSPGNWRKAVTRVVSSIDPKGQKKRAKACRRGRKVALVHRPNSMAVLWTYLPAEVASAIYARVDLIAHKQRAKDDPRTMDQIRADVLSDLLLGKLEGHGGVKANVFLHIPIDTALKITDRSCELVGHGTIPAAIARYIMNNPDSVWRRVLVDPFTGTVKDLGRKTYRPPAALDELVRARDRTCRMPGCNRPAQRCDNDQCQAWSEGGVTSGCAMCCLCRRHRRLKEQPGWVFDLDRATGELRITTPAGRRYTGKTEPIFMPKPGLDPE